MDGKRQYLAVSTAAEATQTRNTRMRRSSRKGDDFIEVGTHYETIGRHEEQHHACFRNWANSTAASSPEKGARVLSKTKQKARDDKIAEQLIKKSLNEARFLALGNTDIAWRARYQNEHQQQGHQFQPNALREGTHQRAN